MFDSRALWQVEFSARAGNHGLVSTFGPSRPPFAFEQLVAVEHDLIDSYVWGELDESERHRFELCYSKSPQQRR
jgi:hypothetical protein